ncbi:MAG: CinA family protein [Nitrospirae bacterium]|nr:CinA family protein [Nitrospirota bacterium]
MGRIFRLIIKDIAQILSAKGSKLAVAESCTGGLISHKITNVPGASEFFVLGVVCYSADAKEKVLGISHASLKKHGTISKETAVSMARGVLKISGADFAISTTGVAGLDRVEGSESGIVHIAVARKDTVVSKMLKFEGGREEIKRAAALEALNFLARMLDEWT